MQRHLVVDVSALRRRPEVERAVARARDEGLSLMIPAAGAYELCKGGPAVDTLRASTQYIRELEAIDLFVIGARKIHLREQELRAGRPMVQSLIDQPSTEGFRAVVRDVVASGGRTLGEHRANLPSALERWAQELRAEDAPRVVREGKTAVKTDNEQIPVVRRALQAGNRRPMHEHVAELASPESVAELLRPVTSVEAARSLSRGVSIVLLDYVAYLIRSVCWAAYGGVENARDERLEHDALDSEYAIMGFLGVGLVTNDNGARLLLSDLRSIIELLGVRSSRS